MVYVTDFDREFPQSSQGQGATSLRQGPLTRLRERLQATIRSPRRTRLWG